MEALNIKPISFTMPVKVEEPFVQPPADQAEPNTPSISKAYNECDPFADEFYDDPLVWKAPSQESEHCWTDDILDKDYAAPPLKKKLAFWKESTTH